MDDYKKNINLISKAYLFFVCFFILPVFAYGDTSHSLDLVTYYPSPNINAWDLTVNQNLAVSNDIVIIDNGNFAVGSNIFRVDNSGLSCGGINTYGQTTFNYPRDAIGTQGDFIVPNFTLTDFPAGEDPYIELRGIALTSMPTLVNTNSNHISYESADIVSNFEARQNSCAPFMKASCPGLGNLNSAGGTGVRHDAMVAFLSVTYPSGGARLSRRKGLRSVTKTGSGITAAVGLCIQGGGFGVGGGLAFDRWGESASFTGRYRTFRYELK